MAFPRAAAWSLWSSCCSLASGGPGREVDGLAAGSDWAEVWAFRSTSIAQIQTVTHSIAEIGTAHSATNMLTQLKHMPHLFYWKANQRTFVAKKFRPPQSGNQKPPPALPQRPEESVAIQELGFLGPNVPPELFFNSQLWAGRTRLPAGNTHNPNPPNDLSWVLHAPLSPFVQGAIGYIQKPALQGDPLHYLHSKRSICSSVNPSRNLL